MPELPEVETIARALRQGGRGGEPIVGWHIHAAHLLWPRTLALPDSRSFAERIAGQVVRGIERRGKFLVIRLSQEMLLIHLRMSGDIRVEPSVLDGGEERPFLPHDRLVIDFEEGRRMAFNDTRKFGRVWFTQDAGKVLGSLGPEPLDPTWTAEDFFAALQKRGGRQIKPLLLDQTFLAGLGNIYTDEALFLAGIHPLRLAGKLTGDQVTALWRAIHTVLEEGIRRNGASFDWVYRGGKFEFQIYQRTGKPCIRCGAPIEKRTVGQRGTHFCPICQPE